MRKQTTSMIEPSMVNHRPWTIRFLFSFLIINNGGCEVGDSNVIRSSPRRPVAQLSVAPFCIVCQSLCKLHFFLRTHAVTRVFGQNETAHDTHTIRTLSQTQLRTHDHASIQFMCSSHTVSHKIQYTTREMIEKE